jgi:hypothetical protein
MNRYAVSMGRVALRGLALLLGALAAVGLSNLAPAGRTTSLVWVVAVGGVWICLGVIPALRGGTRTDRRGTVRHP